MTAPTRRELAALADTWGREQPTCSTNGCPKPTARRGWCWGCYRRWLNADRPDSGPPAPYTRRKPHAPATARRENYAWLRDEQHLAPTQAAARLSVSLRTAWRYEAARRTQETTA